MSNLCEPYFLFLKKSNGYVVCYFSTQYINIKKRCYPIAGATFTTDTFLIPKIASANIGAMGFVLAILLRLYSGWGFVGSRLLSPTIEYEETGWYDGTMEPKTQAERARDLFLYRKDVQPVVDRLQSTTLVVFGLLLVSCLVFQLSLSNQPMFDQYNPQLLKNLELDDTLAEKAAANSQGRPTYCDNRYYTAIANGGQGTFIYVIYIFIYIYIA